MKINIIIPIVLLMALASCTKVVEIDLNEASPQIVMDAYVQDYGEDWKFQKVNAKLTRSMSIYEDSAPEVFDNLEVYATNEQGKRFKLDYNSQAFMYNILIDDVDRSTNWTIETNIEGNEITSETSIPNYVAIDSIVAVKLPFGPRVDGLSPICFFTDIPGEANYFRLKISINGIPMNSLFITRDDGFDGQQIAYPFMNTEAFVGDTVAISLLAIDELSFEYYKVIMQNMGGGFSAAPGNPITNIEGEGVIGVFTGQTISEVTRIIE